MSAVALRAREIAFPDTAWFAALAALMNADRVRHEHLGYVDCVAVFSVASAAAGADTRHFQVTFEEFSAIDVREVDADEAARADFALVASLATWREMIESIAAGRGRPDLEHSLNHLSHMGTPLTLVASDPLKADLYFRYNQSLQEFFNASAGFTTVFPARR
jgi:hypothetical protein